MNRLRRRGRVPERPDGEGAGLSSEEIPELLSLALAFYRSPGRYAELRNARVPLPAGIGELLAAQGRALSDERVVDTAARLGSSPEELRAAQLFFIKQALLEAGGDHYRTLGVARDADSGEIRQHYHYLIRLFHPDRDVDSEGWDNLYAPAINAAWNTLRNPARRAAYDASLPEPDAFDAVMANGHAGSSGMHAEMAGQGAGPTGSAEPSPPGAAAHTWRSRLAAGLRPTPGRVGATFLGLALLILLLVLGNGDPSSSSLRVEPGRVAAGQAAERAGETEDALSSPDGSADRAEASVSQAAPAADDRASGQSGADTASASVADSDRHARPASSRSDERAVESLIRDRLAAAAREVGLSPAAAARRQAAPARVGKGSVPAVPQTGQTEGAAQQAQLLAPPEEGAQASTASSVVASTRPANPLAGDHADTTQLDTAESDTAPRDRVAAASAGTERAPASDAQPDGVPTGLSQTVAAAVPGQAHGAVAPESAGAASPGPVPPLNRRQLDDLVEAFVAHYESGDTEAFAALFSEDADTTDARGRGEISQLYEGFFGRPETRHIRLSRLRWERDGGWRSRGTARAEVETREISSGERARGELQMTFLVEQTAEGPVITGLYYR